jgi:hypothetical protein
MDYFQEYSLREYSWSILSVMNVPLTLFELLSDDELSGAQG